MFPFENGSNRVNDSHIGAHKARRYRAKYILIYISCSFIKSFMHFIKKLQDIYEFFKRTTEHNFEKCFANYVMYMVLFFVSF